MHMNQEAGTFVDSMIRDESRNIFLSQGHSGRKCKRCVEVTLFGFGRCGLEALVSAFENVFRTTN